MLADLPGHLGPKVLELIAQMYPQVLPSDISQGQPTTLLATMQPHSGTLGVDGKMPLALAWSLDSPLVLQSSQWPTPLAFKMQGSLTAAALQESIEANAEFDIGSGKEITSLHATCKIDQPLTKPETSYKASLNGPLASQAMRFIKEPLPLVELLGKATSVDASGSIKASEKSGQLHIQSETMKANIAFILDDDTLQIKPSNFSQVNPDVISSFIPKDKNISSMSIPFTVDIASGKIPLAFSSMTQNMATLMQASA